MPNKDIVKRRETNRLSQMRNRKKQSLMRKLRVMKGYGGESPKCACCGESRLEFLSIDHINGGGGAHKKSINKAGNGFYNWLVKNNFPPGYRVLCYNCNLSLGHLGYCPHEKERRARESGG